MGVTHLWPILAPVKKPVALSDLRGETLAVDLSIWVCESNAVRQMQGVVLKPHLRNLFFRVSNLTQMGIKLIFVIDGEAPDLKRDTMAKRQQARFPGKHKAAPTLVKPKRKGRSQFNTILKECCELLNHLGVPYIYSRGEAEAMCAFLNRQGVADACLTEDGDAFLYGAKTVYRNFTLNTKDPHVESYCAADIEASLGLGQEGLVGLALLLGCDYLPKGVPGVGKEQVLKLIKLMEGVSILDRFASWKTEDGSKLEGIEKAVWKKAMKVDNFPNSEVIDEFLVAKDNCTGKEFRQRRPWIEKLQDFLHLKLDWPREYTEEKVLPLLSLWDMRDIMRTGQHKPALHLVPNRIVKRRVRQGVPCLEVEWLRQDSGSEDNPYYCTVEEEELFARCFSATVQLFEEGEKAKKMSKGRKKVKGDKACPAASDLDLDAVSVVTEGLNNLDLDTKPSQVTTQSEDGVDSSVHDKCTEGISKPLLPTARNRAHHGSKTDKKQISKPLLPTARNGAHHRSKTDKKQISNALENRREVLHIRDESLVNSGLTSSMSCNSGQVPNPVTDMSSADSESEDEEEYIPLSQRIKMATVKNILLKLKTSSKTTENRQNEIKQTEEHISESSHEDNIGANNVYLENVIVNHVKAVNFFPKEKPSAVDKSQTSTVIRVFSLEGGDNSNDTLLTPADKPDDHCIQNGEDLSFDCTPISLRTNAYDQPEPVSVSDATLFTGENGYEPHGVITITCVSPQEDRCTLTSSGEISGCQPGISISDKQEANLDGSLYNDSVDLFSPAKNCTSFQPLGNKLFSNLQAGNNFSSPVLISVPPKKASKLQLRKKTEMCSTLENDVLSISPGTTLHNVDFQDESLVRFVSTPQVMAVKSLAGSLFDSPNVYGASPGYGCFNLESSLLNLTADSQVRNPLTPLTCSANVKVKVTSDSSNHQDMQCNVNMSGEPAAPFPALADIAKAKENTFSEELFDTAAFNEKKWRKQSNINTCAQPDAEITGRKNIEMDDKLMDNTSTLPHQGEPKNQKVSPNQEYLQTSYTKEQSVTQSRDVQVVPGVGPCIGTKLKQKKKDCILDLNPSVGKENLPVMDAVRLPQNLSAATTKRPVEESISNSCVEKMKTLQVKKMCDSKVMTDHQSYSENSVRQTKTHSRNTQAVALADFCRKENTTGKVEEGSSYGKVSSPLALADRLKLKLGKLTTRSISGDTILSVKKVNTK